MRSRVLTLLAVVAMVVSACSSSATTPPASAPASAAAASASAAPPAASATASSAPVSSGNGSTLRFDWLGDLTPIWHPAGYETFSQAVIFSLIFSHLVKLDKDEKTILPDLADTWTESPDATQFTFHLHPGVTWQDGTPFTSADVVFTITQSFKYKFRDTNAEWEEVLGADAVKAGTATTLSGVTAPDANTVKITLAHPNSIFLAQITEPEDVIVPQHILQSVDPAGIEKAVFSTTTPIGTGPYKFIKYVTDQEVDFVANPTYFEGAPKIQNLFMLRTPANAAVAQAASGGVDLVLRIAPGDFQAASQIAAANVISVPGVGETSGLFNLQSVTSKDLRQAIYYAIDRKGIVSSIFTGRARVLEAPPGFTEYPDLNAYAYDPAKAKTLLQSSGWDVTKPFRIIYDQTYPSVTDYMPVIQQDLQAIGMNVELDPLDSTTFIARSTTPAQRNTWEMAMENGGAEGVTPANSAQYYDCTRPTFYAGYTNCNVDTWFKDALQTADPAMQDGFYHQIATALNTDLPSVYLWSPDAIHIASKKLGGSFAIYPDPRDSFFTISTWTFGQ